MNKAEWESYFPDTPWIVRPQLDPNLYLPPVESQGNDNEDPDEPEDPLYFNDEDTGFMEGNPNADPDWCDSPFYNRD